MIKKMAKHPLTSMYIAQGHRNGETLNFIRNIKAGYNLDPILSRHSWYNGAGVPIDSEPKRILAVRNLTWYKDFMKQQYGGE